MDVNDEWRLFQINNSNGNKKYEFEDVNTSRDEILRKYNIHDTNSEIHDKDIKCDEELEVPSPSPLYISTKTLIAHIDMSKCEALNIEEIFWNLPVTPYHIQDEGIIKKQIVIKCKEKSELCKLESNLEKLKQKGRYKETILKSIDDPNGCTKFTEERNISVGICKKDILTKKKKIPRAFANCVALIMRINMDGRSYDYHVKIFDTKFEIPGVKDIVTFNKIKKRAKEYIEHIFHKNIYFIEKNNEEVLINSNFKCGFHLNREKLASILRTKYKMMVIYDPCIYPGVQCKYSNSDLFKMFGIVSDPCLKDNKKNKKNKSGSFMIFRTGSVLIMGKLTDERLYKMYTFITNILKTEFLNIQHSEPYKEKETSDDVQEKRNKKKKYILVQNKNIDK